MNNLLDGSALLPTPPPDDATAYDLIQKYDTATPEEQASIAPQLKAYADAKDAAANSAKALKWQQIYSDPNTLGGHISSIKDDPALTHSTTPDETTSGAANMAYLSDTTGMSMDELAQNWPSIRSGYALKNHGKDAKNDKEFFGLIAQDVARKKASSDSIGKLPGDAVVQAFQDVVTGKDTSTLDTFNAWKDQHPDIVRDYPEATLHKLYSDLYSKTAQLIAPLAPQAKAIFDSLAKDTGRPDATASAIDPAQLASQIQDLPPAQKQALYTIATVYAERTGQSKGFWTQIGESIGRSVTGTVGSVSLAAKQNEIQGQIDLLKNGQAAIMPDGTIIPLSGAMTQTAQDYTTPTEEQKTQLTAKLQEQLKGITTVRELNALASQQIDPIKPVVDWMPHALEMGLYAAAGSLPLVATSLLQPEVGLLLQPEVGLLGLPVVGAAIFGQEFDRISLAYPNLPTSQINTMAALSAAPQTALMNLRAEAILGKLPVLGNYLQKLGNPQMNPIFRAGLNTIGQSAEQGIMNMVQSAVPMMVDGLAKAAGADMPEYDLGKALEAYADSTPEILFSVLPFALIGAGVATHSDIRRGEAMTRNSQSLREMGYSQPEADRISKIEDPEKRRAEIRATWKNRTLEDIDAGKGLIAQRIASDIKTQADPATPTLRAEEEMINGTPTGNKIYTVLDEQGNQKIQTTDPEAALHYYQTAQSDAASNERSHLKILVDYFQGLDKAQGRERTYVLDTKKVTAADEVSAGQSPEQLKERMEQEGIRGGLPLDQVLVFGKTTADLSRQIYSDTIEIFSGYEGTLFHERLDGEVMAAIHEGRISEDQFLEWCRQTEAATAEKWLPEIPEGTTHSSQQVREAVTKIGEAYLAGRIRKVEQIAPGLRGIIRGLMEYFRHVLARAKVLREAIDAGKIDANFHSFLAQSVGLPEGDLVEQHAANATRETVKGMEQRTEATAQTSYMVAPSGKGHRIIRQESVPNPVKIPKDEFPELKGTKEFDPWRTAWNQWEKEKREEWRQEITTPDGKIQLNGTTAKEMNRIAKGETPSLHYMAAANLPELLKNSVLSDVHDDHRGHPKVEEIHRRYAWMDAPDGSRHHVLLTVKRWKEEMKRDHDTAYSADVGIEVDPQPRDSRRATDVSAERSGQQGRGSTDTYAQFLGGIKSEHQHPDHKAYLEGKNPSSLTETGGTASYSLTTKAEQDRLQAALEKHLNRSPEARLAVYERMRANLDRVIAKNNASMLELRDGRDYQISESEQNAEADRTARIADLHAEEQQEIRDALDANAAKFMGKIEGASPSEKRSINAQAKDRAAIIEKGIRSKYDEKIKAIENEARIQKPMADGREKYAQMIQSIGELEAVIKALPMEIRGKIGGYREILTKSTDAGRTTVLLKRIEMADKALEKLLLDGYDDQLNKILDRSKPKKNEPGEKPKGIGADIQRIFSVLKEARSWMPEDAQAHIEKLQGLIDKGEMTPEQEAHAQQEMGLVAHISDWRNADSVRRSEAVKAIKNAWEKGYSEHITRVLQRREKAERRRATLIQETGTEGTKIERKERELADAKLGSAWGKTINGFYSFDQLVHSIFGNTSKEASLLSDGQRKADNLKEDRLQARWDELSELFTGMMGNKQMGEELRYAMSQPSVDFNGLRLSELESLSATMMWMQEDGQRHMRGKFDDSGKVVSSWGYTQKDIDKLEAKLTPQGRMLREYLLKKYEADWHTLNAVFREENGMDLPRNKNYSPLTVKPQRTQGNQMVDPVSGVASSGMSTTPGSLLSRGTSVAEPDFRDVLQTYIGHNMQMEHYKAYASFNRETAAVLRHRDLSNAVEAGAGLEARQVLGKWLDYFAQGGTRDAASSLAINQLISKGTGRAAQMALVGKIGTILVQSSQLTAAYAEMPTGSYVKRLSMLLTGNLDWSAAFNSPYIQRRIKELPPIARQAMDGLKSDKPTTRKAIMQYMGTLIGGADGLFTAGTYAMCYDYHLTLAKEMGMTGAEAEAHARNTAERATDRLAQPTRAGAKSLYENISMGNPLARLAFSFASELRKNIALAAYSMANRTPAEKARTAAFVFVLSGLVGNIIRSAWSDAKDDSDSETFDTKHWNWKRIAINTAIEPFKGIPVIGSAIEKGALGLAGIYSPYSDLLTQPVQETVRTAKHVPNYIDGTADRQMLMKDVDGILHVMGLFSSEIAAYKSMENLAKDVWGVGANAKKAATEEK